MVEVTNAWWDVDLVSIRTHNQITDELVDKVKEVLEEENKVSINFDVTGATLFDILAHQLRDRLPEYNTEICRYKCIVLNK